MPEEIDDKDILKNNKVVYEEVKIFRKGMHEDINLLNNKLNWLLGSSIILIGFIMNNGSVDKLYLLSYFLLLISIVLCLFGLFARSYKNGPDLKEMHKEAKKIKNKKMIASLNKKIINDIKDNKKAIRDLKIIIASSIISILLSVILVFINFFEICSI